MAKKTYRMYPYFKNGRFLNYSGEKPESVIRSVFMLLESLLQRTRCIKHFKRTWVLKNRQFKHDPGRISQHPLVTWVGHATFLVQIAGLTVATDPIFGSSSVFFKRITKPGVALDELPKIDVVIISHNHPDHMHLPSLRVIARKNPDVRFFVPLGDKQWFDAKGLNNTSEYTWWDAVDVFVPATNKKIKFSFLPAYHWSGRGLFDRNKSLWGSWMIQSVDHTLYFAGDTAYGPHFKSIAQEFPQIDTALMPIGPCEPHEDMKLTHVSAEQAGQAFIDLQAHCFIPMHWGVYWFGTDHPSLPIERLQTWWTKNADVLSTSVLNTLKFGQSFECVRVQKPSKKIETQIQKSLQKTLT